MRHQRIPGYRVTEKPPQKIRDSANYLGGGLTFLGDFYYTTGLGAIPQTLRRNGFGAKKADLDAYPIFSPTIFVTPRKCPRIGNDSRAWNWLPSQELHLSPQRTDV